MAQQESTVLPNGLVLLRLTITGMVLHVRPAVEVTVRETVPVKPLTPFTIMVEEPDSMPAGGLMFAGLAAIAKSTNRTVTVEDDEPRLPAASVAVQVTVVVPNEKAEPEAGEQVVGKDPLTMSIAVAENVATAPAGPVASRPTGNPDIDTNGGVVSRTVTVEDAKPTLPAASVAVHLTTVVPSGNVEPEG